MTEEFITNNVNETKKIAAELSSSLKGGETVALFGDLGAGKTYFVKGLAEGLGFTGEVTSPTFNIVNEYLGGKFDIYHFDMYRITGWDDLDSTGFFEYISSGGITVTEWSENIENALSDDSIRVYITKTDENKRKIVIKR
ncbi:MAG: tRNA (adenosine(37)-N6)-threonylcarbamoyltransferase complex ATPase subunit type 1 TsaE [Clostridia bacterium]|nr:tRNA (adenosine(37)-N6)-threonylcarbamoyltransferase complex ATPase subunit type 1 TsaE [Clostridia bacterium]